MAEIRVNRNLTALQTVTVDTVVPDGETWTIQRMICFGVTFEAKVIWDADGTPDYLFNAETPFNMADSFECVGDGSKILRISIKNKLSLSAQIAGIIVHCSEDATTEG